MRRLTALSLLLVLTAPAGRAEPVTLTELRDAFAGQGADALETVEQNGQPVLIASLLGQPFEAALYTCSGPEPACNTVRYRACRDLPDHSRIEALEIANGWNQGDRDAILTAEEEWFGQALCVRLLQDIGPATRFGTRQASDWQIELEDFLQTVDTAITDRQAANMLDSATQ